MPSWLDYKADTRELSGSPNYVQAHERDSLVLEFVDILTKQRSTQVIKLVSNINAPPVLLGFDYIAHVETYFDQEIQISDPDLSLGDTISGFSAIKPSWMTVRLDADRGILHLFGIPQFENVGDTLVVIKVSDAIGAPGESTFSLTVRPVVSLSGQGETCAGRPTSLRVRTMGQRLGNFA